MELTPDSRDENLWWSEDPAGIGEALAAHDEIFGRVVRARPRDRNLLIARFHYFGRRRRWPEAAEMAARILALDPKERHAPEYHRALLFFSGDLEGYRRAIREELAAVKERNPNLFGSLEMLGQFEFPRADATGPPPQYDQDGWERLKRGVNDYREGRYAGAIRQLTEVTRSSARSSARTVAHLFLAMAHQRLGQVAEARRELDAVRKGPDVLKRDRWFGVPELASGELMSYGWTELVIATIVLREAEALIVYDPIFPADPFAR
jgi:tetratricopeptide (TPR) repeat protein